MSPFIALYYGVIRQDTEALLRFAYRVGLVLSASAIFRILFLVLRGVGRSKNAAYSAFLADWTKARSEGGAAVRALTSKYDFDFSFVPPAHTQNSMPTAAGARGWSLRAPLAAVHHAAMWCIAFGFARLIIYPGSLRLVGWMMGGEIVVRWRGVARGGVARGGVARGGVGRGAWRVARGGCMDGVARGVVRGA